MRSRGGPGAAAFVACSADGTTDRQLLIAITPHRAGRVVVRGVRLSYRSGLRWGTQTTGVLVDVTVP